MQVALTDGQNIIAGSLNTHSITPTLKWRTRKSTLTLPIGHDKLKVCIYVQTWEYNNHNLFHFLNSCTFIQINRCHTDCIIKTTDVWPALMVQISLSESYARAHACVCTAFPPPTHTHSVQAWLTFISNSNPIFNWMLQKCINILWMTMEEAFEYVQGVEEK